jgi:hypothetical protein
MPYVEPWAIVWDDYGHARLVPPAAPRSAEERDRDRDSSYLDNRVENGSGRVSAPANPHPTPPRVGRISHFGGLREFGILDLTQIRREKSWV